MKLSKTQEEAMELLKTLAKEDRVNMEELFLLMKAIYENETITITSPTITPYVPYTEPWKPNTPWYENPVTCDCRAHLEGNEPATKMYGFYGYPCFSTNISK